MTNREWLESLTDEEFVLYLNYKMCDHVDCRMCKMFFADMQYRENHKTDKCLKEHIGCRLLWLQAEHKEYKNND